MTREMNKPDWERKRLYEYRSVYPEPEKPKERILNPDIAEFFENCCKFEKVER